MILDVSLLRTLKSGMSAYAAPQDQEALAEQVAPISELLRQLDLRMRR